MARDACMVAKFDVLENCFPRADCSEKVCQVRSLEIKRKPAEAGRCENTFFAGGDIVLLAPLRLVVLADPFRERICIVTGFGFGPRLWRVSQGKLGNLEDAF